MSSGQTPRTTRYFPNMRPRGRRAKRLLVWNSTARAFDRLGVESKKAAESIKTLTAFSQRED